MNNSEEVDSEILKEATLLVAAAKKQKEMLELKKNTIELLDSTTTNGPNMKKKKQTWQSIPCPLMMKMPQKYHKRCAKCMFSQGYQKATLLESGYLLATTRYCPKCYVYNTKLAEKYFDEVKGKVMREAEDKEYYGLNE